MIIVLFFLAILLLFSLLVFLIVFSTLETQIQDLHLSNFDMIKGVKDKIWKYKIIIRIKFLNRLTIFKLKLDEKKIKKLYEKTNEKNDLVKKMENYVFTHRDIFSVLKKLKPQITKFHLDLSLGTEDAILTSFLVAGLASIISILLPRCITGKNVNLEENYQYQINPIYLDKNVYKIWLNCIIRVKIVHIIYVIDILFKKRRDEKHERASNRRSYDYSYE